MKLTQLDSINKFSDVQFILKPVNGGRILYSYEGLVNNDEFKWVIKSKSYENGVCPENVDSIILDKEKQFIIEYIKQ